MTTTENEKYTPEEVFLLIVKIICIPIAVWLLCEAWDYFHAYYDIYALSGANE